MNVYRSKLDRRKHLNFARTMREIRQLSKRIHRLHIHKTRQENIIRVVREILAIDEPGHNVDPNSIKMTKGREPDREFRRVFWRDLFESHYQAQLLRKD